MLKGVKLEGSCSERGLTTRRHFLKYAGGALGASVALANGSRTKAAVTRVNGAGSYRLGPFVHADQPDRQVFLFTDFGFDETFVSCKVSTNREPFLFPTATLGTLRIERHEFYMAMESTEINNIVVVESAEGPVVGLDGKIRSVTIIGSGSREQVFEGVSPFFTCRALDRGTPGREKGDFFSMLAVFSVPGGQREIFGERAEFQGQLISGNVMVIP